MSWRSAWLGHHEIDGGWKLTEYCGQAAGCRCQFLPIMGGFREPNWIAEYRVPTRNVNLTEELDRFVETHITSGQYANASEVFRAGLRALGERERLYEAKLERVRAAIDEGDAAEDADYSLDGLLAEIGRE
jgi:antitoxin ParD1/3/4